MIVASKAVAAKGGAFVNEFKAFVLRGNVVDLAVGIIIGAAFTTIVDSLVKDIIMPPIGLLTGGVDFADLYINLTNTTYPSFAAAQEAGAATINIGRFINAIVNFLIVSFAIFMIVKQLSRLQRKQAAEAVAEPPPPPRSEVLLEEIRDLLKERR